MKGEHLWFNLEKRNKMLKSLKYQSKMLGWLSRQSLIGLGQEDPKSGLICAH